MLRQLGARCASSGALSGAAATCGNALTDGATAGPSAQVRELLGQALKALTGKKDTDKANRKLFDVEWYDEYATLGDDPHETHAAMVAEDRRLRRSAVFRNPLRRQVFHEIDSHRRRFAAVRAPCTTIADSAHHRRVRTLCCAGAQTSRA